MRPQASRLLASLVLGALAGCGPSPVPRQSIVVVVDTLRRDGLGCYGAAQDPTPRIDRLAREGTRFDQAISASGWTLPAVASLLTGTWPSVHKALGKKTRLTPITADLPTAGEVLAQAGFRTGAVANAAFLSPLLALDRGFAWFSHEHAYNDELRSARESFDDALEFVRANAGADFFLLVHLFDPHLDYDPSAENAARFREPSERFPSKVSILEVREIMDEGMRQPTADEIAYVRGSYQAEVADVDAAFGGFLDELAALGVYERATLVLTADHGEEFWDHGGFEHGHTLYDELIRVPLIVKPPVGTAPVEPVVEAQVRVLDVMPTIFELSGVEPPASFVGESLMPLVRGATRASRFAFSEGILYGTDMHSLRGERYKYIAKVSHSVLGEELYDWRVDPGEKRNLILSEPERAEELRLAYQAFMAELNAAAAKTRAGEVKNMHPDQVAEYVKSMKSHGYVGEDEDEEEADHR